MNERTRLTDVEGEGTQTSGHNIDTRSTEGQWERLLYLPTSRGELKRDRFVPYTNNSYIPLVSSCVGSAVQSPVCASRLCVCVCCWCRRWPTARMRYTGCPNTSGPSTTVCASTRHTMDTLSKET